jgi:DNA-binding SARP family transcriptional activator
MKVQLLGPVGVVTNDGPAPIGGLKQRTVLAVLCSDPGTPVSMDRLIDAVWGDAAPDRASRSVSTYVSNLRSILGGVIARDGRGYVADLSRSDVDATDFADRVQAARRLADTQPTVAAAQVRDALSLPDRRGGTITHGRSRVRGMGGDRGGGPVA